MELIIKQIGEYSSIYIDGVEIPNVKKYQLKSSESGETELSLVLTVEMLSTTLAISQ